MDAFYAHQDVVIDPMYKSIDDYAVDYDYDLLGHPVRGGPSFWLHHLLYMRIFLTDNRWNIFIVICVLILLLLFAGFIVRSLIAIGTYLFYWCHWKQELGKVSREARRPKTFAHGDDPDQYAAVYCRAVANSSKVASLHRPTPRDLPDYEAVRFIFQQPWLVEKTHRALQASQFHGIFDELTQAELEDALQLAREQGRLKIRKPLPCHSRLAAKRALAKADYDFPYSGILSPEMKMIQGWEELYRKQYLEAIEENYRWWLAQYKTLPVEAKEVREKLQPIVAEVRKHRINSPIDDDLQIDFSRIAQQQQQQQTDQGQSVSRRRGATQEKAELVDQYNELDESKMLKELEEAEQAQVAKVKHATRHASRGKRDRRQERGKKED